MKNSKYGAENPFLFALRAVVIGAVSGAVLCALLLCLCAFLFVSSKSLPQGLLFPLVLGLSAISAFIGGWITARISKKRGLLYGALSGLFLFLLFLMAGLVASNEMLGFPTLLRLVLMTLASAAGGLLGVNRRSKTKIK